MHRIDGNGHAANLFTEGAPPVTPATQVTDDWLNDVQEELANFIEDAPASVSLVKGTQTQLISAFNNRIAALWTSLVTLTNGILITASTASRPGVEATGGAGGHGVYGKSGTGNAAGGRFSATGTIGAVLADNSGSGAAGRFENTGTGDGVWASAVADNVAGVYGKTTYNASTAYGVKGEATAANGIGVRGVATSGSGVRGSADSGAGGHFSSTSGYGAQLNGNSTNAPLLIVAQSAQPSVASLGAIYVDSDDSTLYFYNGATWKAVALV